MDFAQVFLLLLLVGMGVLVYAMNRPKGDQSATTLPSPSASKPAQAAPKGLSDPLSTGPAQPFPTAESQFKGRPVFVGVRKQDPREKLSKFNPGPVSPEFAMAFDSVYAWMWERADYTTKANGTEGPGQKEDVRRAAYLWTIMFAYCQYDEGLMNSSFVRLWSPPMLSGPRPLLRQLREGWEKRADSADRTTALNVLNEVALDLAPWGHPMITVCGFAGMITGAVVDPLENK